MNEPTKPRQIRIADGHWTAYERVCDRLGTTRAEDINNHIRRRIEDHGDDADKALLAQADAEIEERRARKGGRPRNR